MGQGIKDGGDLACGRMTEAVTMEPASDFPGTDDGMERLWTPHRMVYIDSNNDANREPACPFCEAQKKSDEDALIVYRGETCFVILNLYPYNSGHLLICPYRHVPDYTDLTQTEVLEFAELTRTAMTTLRRTSRPAGFNIGMNQGRVAGAGVAEHLHQHVVPRWVGDANFFPIVGRTKALPQLLSDTREMLARAWSTT